MAWRYQNQDDLWATFANALATVEYVHDVDLDDQMHEEEEAVNDVQDIVDSGVKKERHSLVSTLLMELIDSGGIN